MKNKESIEVSKQVDAYLRGKLSKREIDELWLQFLRNPYYFELFETELQLRNLTHKNRYTGDLINEKKNRNTIIKQLVMAAAACVIVVLVFQFYTSNSTPDLDTLALTSISYHEMAAGNVVRSDDVNVINVETGMNRAMAAAYQFNVDESIEMFRELKGSVVNDSQRGRIEYNLAILHYNRAEFELAKEAFIMVTNSDAVEEIYIERAWWFLANTYLKLNDQEEAIETILMVKHLNGMNRELAATLHEILMKRSN